jgi:hypothetical protein
MFNVYVLCIDTMRELTVIWSLIASSKETKQRQATFINARSNLKTGTLSAAWLNRALGTKNSDHLRPPAYDTTAA